MTAPSAGRTARTPPPALSSSADRTVSPAAVHVRGLRKAYGDRTVLDRIDLDVPAGEVIALLGRSGCGKSTLVRVLAGLETADAADAVVTGRVAVAFQEPRLLPWRTVWRNVVLATEGRGTGAAAAAVALAEVGLTDRADAWPGTLSGGEAQRVSLARALVGRPEVLLLDEPFAALDALTRASMHALLRRLHRTHRPTVVLVTHDVDEALSLADRALVLADGRIALDRPVPHAPGAHADDGVPPERRPLRRELLEALGAGRAGR